MFVQSEKFIEAHGGRIDSISIYGQESNRTTWRLCKMNLAIRGIDANIAWGNSFHNDAHKDLKADFILANPPFNDSDWGSELLIDDVRWRFGTPPKNNANFAWVQHFIYHLAPNANAGFVLANGSMSSSSSGEGEIRKGIIDADLIDCMVALPGQLFYSTSIPACLWFIAQDKSENSEFRDRKGEILFIDASNAGTMVDTRHRELSDAEIEKIAFTHHSWCNIGGDYEDIKGFCKSVSATEIRQNRYVLTPGRYIEPLGSEEDKVPFEEQTKKLAKELNRQFKESAALETKIRQNLNKLGFGGDVS